MYEEEEERGESIVTKFLWLDGGKRTQVSAAAAAELSGEKSSAAY